MKFNLSLKKKYSNKVSTISYSAWNEPLSALINQQDPLMRAFKDYIAFSFLSISFYKNHLNRILFFQLNTNVWKAKLCPWHLSRVLVGHFWHLLLLKATLRSASNSKLLLELEWKFLGRIFQKIIINRPEDFWIE